MGASDDKLMDSILVDSFEGAVGLRTVGRLTRLEFRHTFVLDYVSGLIVWTKHWPRY
jgi:hypothetical protein